MSYLLNGFKIQIIFLVCIVFFEQLAAQNPIVSNRGLNDPHIHIFNDTAYLYASHDRSKDNTTFVMDDWWVWSSPDLVNWTYRSTLKPNDTYIGKDFTRCWATDAAYRNGKYYWYFSEGNQQTGVVVGPTPTGPWTDVLGKPLLDSTLTPTHEYDMAIFEDAGNHYIIFGVWDYYIAKLNDDMISLAEKPKKIILDKLVGPYGEGKTDDKPFVHKHKDKYYLSWGAFYAMADNVYGPYVYKGAVLNKESFAPGYEKPTWPNGFLQGRHGSFFEWHYQWYFAYCDISQTGNRYFRDTFISYVHYKNNGEIAMIRVNGTGVGRYEATAAKIEFEDYFESEGIEVVETTDDFVVRLQGKKAHLTFPNIIGMETVTKISVQTNVLKKGRYSIHLTGFIKDKKYPLGTLKLNESKLGIQEVVISFQSPTSGTIDKLVFEIGSTVPKGIELNSFICEK